MEITRNGSFSNEVFFSKQSRPISVHDEESNRTSTEKNTDFRLETEQSEQKSDAKISSDIDQTVDILSNIDSEENDFSVHEDDYARLMNKELDKKKRSQLSFDEALDLCQLSQDYWQKGELEEAVEVLDRAYYQILNVNTFDEAKMMQQKEDLRFMIAKRLLEIYASRNIVISGNYGAIPVVINKFVQKEINLFTTGGEKDFFIKAYKRSGRYRPQIIKSLKKAGLPEELSWLPLIESGFKVKALSRSRALGLWQFIPSTGYKFGLDRDKFIDERMDPEKSTRAAIDYLKELHRLFGDWSTVLAAYNCGEGRVLKIIRSQKVNYLDNFWDLFERLPWETARYVPRFLATLHIIKNLEKYDLNNIVVDHPLEYEIVMVSKRIHLKDIAKTTRIDLNLLQELNPELRFEILPDENYPIRMPKGSGELLLVKIDKIPTFNIPKRAFVYHRVRSGETLFIIARRYRTSVSRIMRANHLQRSKYIVAGKIIKIPQKGYVESKFGTIKVAGNSSRGLKHVVRKGDSLWVIAKNYGTSINKIKKLNHMTSNSLYVGQVLKISQGQPKVPPNVNAFRTYVVRPGDNPSLIAKQHSMKIERLLYLNKLYPSSKIFPGQHLYIE